MLEKLYCWRVEPGPGMSEISFERSPHLFRVAGRERKEDEKEMEEQRWE